MVMVGDLNIAPSEYDVWNHRYMLKVVSHTPSEIEAMGTLMAAGAFTDLVREPIRSRRSWRRGGAIAPPTSASPIAACGWTTSGSPRDCARRPS